MVQKNVDLDESVWSVKVLLFHRARGRVVFFDPRCTSTLAPRADDPLDGLEPQCEPDIGPRYLSIENRTYALAPGERRCFLPGETVDVLAVDFDPMQDLDR